MARAKQDASTLPSTGRKRRRHVLMVIDMADDDLIRQLRKQFPKASFTVLDEAGDGSRDSDVRAQGTASSLTPRQAAILHLLQCGLSNKEIARRLAISPFTVRNHVSLLLRALKVATRQEAATLAGTAAPSPP